VLNSIFNKAGVKFYQDFLDTASKAQKVTAENIANVSTPGYTTGQVNFRQEMERCLESSKHLTPHTTDLKHITTGSPNQIAKVEEISGDDKSSGINGVDIEKEMTALAENQMLYEFGAKRLSQTFGVLRMAIRGKSQ
jgi:flagellar basal-body rod protein FlgB